MSGLTGNTAYWIRVTHTDPDGVTGTNPSTSTSGFLTYPGTPGTPTFSGVTGTSITVNWTAPAGGASYYKIERCTGTGCATFSQIATSSTTSYTDSGLTGNTVYRYRIRATNATGDGSYSTPAEQLTLPGTPGNPTFSNVASTSMTVNWTAPTGGASFYRVERAPDVGGSPGAFSEIATTTSLSYGDSGLTCATTYWYRVRAANATGNGSYSGNASQATAACGGGGGNITMVGTAQSGTAANGADVTLTFDVTPQQNDVVILWGGIGGTGTFGPVTAGYTAIITDSATAPRGGMWYKVMGSTPDTNVVGAGSGSASNAVVYGSVVLRGVDTANVLDVAATGTFDGATTTAPDSPSITTVTNNAWIIAAAVKRGANSTPGSISGYTYLAGGAATDTNRVSSHAAYKVKTTAGADDPAAWSTWTGETGAGNWDAFTAAIRPAP